MYWKCKNFQGRNVFFTNQGYYFLLLLLKGYYHCAIAKMLFII